MSELYAVLIATYVIGVLFLGTVYTIAVVKLNGFKSFANYTNATTTGPDYTETSVQWYIALSVLAWPVICLAAILATLLKR